MRTKKFKEKRIALVEPKGDLNASQAAKLENCLSSLIRQGYVRLVLNMERVEHINYSCFKNMIERSETIKKFQGELFVVGVNKYLLSILQLIGAEEYFHVCPNNFSEKCQLSSTVVNEDCGLP